MLNYIFQVGQMHCGLQSLQTETKGTKVSGNDYLVLKSQRDHRYNAAGHGLVPERGPFPHNFA